MLDLIGRFHPVVLHLPIGILLMAIVFDWLSRIKKYKSLKKSVRLALWIGAATSILSCVTGFLLSQQGDYDSVAVSRHQWSAIALTLLALIYATIKTNRQFKSWHRFFSVLTLAGVIVTGHLGGTLTHGADFLTFQTVGESELDLSSVNLEQARFYKDLVVPVLSTKCYSCHGSSKQKGKLRLDAPEYISKGGKNGAVLVAGNIDDSEIINRLMLPLDDEDHMPPKEKKQLTEKERKLLKLWVASGADFNQSVKEAGQLVALEQLISGNKNDLFKSVPTVPEKEVAPASEDVILKLRNSGVVILPVAQGSHYLSANLINANSLDEVVENLSILSEQVVWLKAGNKLISDAHLARIASLKKLVKLSLDNSAITDQGLAELKALNQLQYLNLTNTSITAQGIRALRSLQKLSTLYIYQTGIKPEELEGLRKEFPNVVIEIGNYEVPTLESDTIILKTSANN